jgi:flagellar motor switch protein FliG
MALIGKQKAAMLLMSLDVASAAELLKGLGPEKVQEIALELARIEASDQRDLKQQEKVAREFCNSLNKQVTQKLGIRTFLDEILVNILDRDQAQQLEAQIKQITEKKDLFMDIRTATTDELVLALEGELPQTIAVVLSELAPKKSQEVLPLLNEDVRSKVACLMTNPELVGRGVRERMTIAVTQRLKSLKGETLVESSEQTLRKLAIVLNGLEKELRDELLGEITKHDKETASIVRRLMVTWEDIPSVADRSLQEALRVMDSKELAVALHGAEEEIGQKIRSNISERALATLEEELSLMQEPLDKEVLEAREAVVKPLREANEEGKLRVTGR